MSLGDFDDFRPRPVDPGEHPVWDEALAVVDRDLAASLPEQGSLRLMGLPGWEEGDPENVYVALADGRWWGNPLPDGSGDSPAAAVSAVAEAAQDTVTECLWRAWPVCADHDLGMHLRTADGRPVWWCPDGHVRGAVGELADTQHRPRRPNRKKRRGQK